MKLKVIVLPTLSEYFIVTSDTVIRHHAVRGVHTNPSQPGTSTLPSTKLVSGRRVSIPVTTVRTTRIDAGCLQTSNKITVCLDWKKSQTA